MTDGKMRISAAQLFAVLFVVRAVIMLNMNSAMAGGTHLLDNVLSCALALTLNFALILPIFFLTRRHPGKNVLELAGELPHGLGWAVAAIYLLYFLLMDTHYLSFFELFLANCMDPMAPLWLVAAAVLGTAVYAALRGVEAVVRAAGFVAVVMVLGVVFIIAALAPEVEPLNYEPLLYGGPRQMLTGTLLFLGRSTSFATLALLLPFTKGRRKLGFMVWNVGVYALMAALILVMVGAMGLYLDSQLFPVFAASAYATAGVLEDLDAIFTGVSIAGLFVKLALDLCLVGMCAARLFGAVARRWAVPGAAVLVGAASLLVVRSRALQGLLFGAPLLMGATLTTACLIPVALLLADIWKKRRGRIEA